MAILLSHSVTSGRHQLCNSWPSHIRYPQLGFLTCNRGVGSLTTSCRPAHHPYHPSASFRFTTTSRCSEFRRGAQGRIFLHSRSRPCRVEAETQLCTRVVFRKYIPFRQCSSALGELSNRTICSVSYRISSIRERRL